MRFFCAKIDLEQAVWLAQYELKSNTDEHVHMDSELMKHTYTRTQLENLNWKIDHEIRGEIDAHPKFFVRDANKSRMNMDKLDLLQWSQMLPFVPLSVLLPSVS